MNNQDSNSNGSDSSDIHESTPPKTHPLSSPNEPTRAYPTDPTRTYSSDPSQYAYPKKSSDESSKIYTTEPFDPAPIATDEKKEKKQETVQEQIDPSDSRIDNEMNIHKQQTITYILLIIGLVLVFFIQSLLGELIIGMVTGYYFAYEIMQYLRNLGHLISQNYVPHIVLAAFILTLFIAAPGIFIGAIVVAVFKQLMISPKD